MHEKQATTQFHAALRDVGRGADISKLKLEPEFQQQRQTSTSSQTSSQSSDNGNETTVRGCLSGSSGNYTLTSDSGTTYLKFEFERQVAVYFEFKRRHCELQRVQWRRYCAANT